LKLPNKAASAVSTPEPAPEAAPMDDAPMDDMPMDDTAEPAGDAPFDKTPFDAGVEADEEEDPKKFIEQLAGKIATTLRTFTKDEGEPDFELEKYVINSVIAATHTAEMDEEDRKDIVKKIEDSGKGDDEPEEDMPEAAPEDEAPVEDEEPIDEGTDENAWGPDKTFVTDTKRSAFENDTRMFEEEMEESKHFEMKDLLGEGGDEEGNPTRYMFFSNLEQMRRQAGLLLDLDEGQIEAILNSGHDWAADHIATAKESFDQVFDFLMNETNSGDMWKSVDMEDREDDEEDYDYSEWSKPMELKKEVEISDGLKYHMDNKLALGESVYRYGSDNFFNLLKEVKTLYTKGLIKLNENDIFIVNDIDSKVRLNGQIFQLGQIMESEEENVDVKNIDDFLLNNGFNRIGLANLTDDKKMDEFLLMKGYNRISLANLEKKDKINAVNKELNKGTLTEAEYQGKKVELGKPKRGGSKKFYVYVKNPKTGKVKKVSFGAKAGGGNLSVKLKDPKARKAFADRHNCEQKNDKTTPGYWSCRLPRYAKLLGLSGGGRFW
jgi:hypothetical protein